MNEQDEQDLGAFYLRDRKPIEQPIVRSARLSSSDVTPRTSSRRSSHVSFNLASPQIHHQPQKATPLNLCDYMDEVLILRKMIEELNHLVSIFDVDETDMDGYVISALLSSGRFNFTAIPLIECLHIRDPVSDYTVYFSWIGNASKRSKYRTTGGHNSFE